MALQINLLPDVKKEFLHAQRQRNLVMSISIIASIAAGATILVLALVLGGQMIQKTVLMGNIENKKSQIEEAKKTGQLNEYLTVQNQLSQIESLKQKQPQFSRVFSYINQINPSNVQVSALRITSANAPDGAGAGAIEIQGMTNDFSTLDAYKQTLLNAQIIYANGEEGDVVTEKLFRSVNVGDYGSTETDSGEKKVSFTINVQYNEAAFKLGTTRITVNVPKQTTSDALRTAPNEKKSDNKNNNSANTEEKQ